MKSIVADQTLDIRVVKDVLAKNGNGPRRSDGWWRRLIATYGLSQRRLGLMEITRGSYRVAKPDRNQTVPARLRALA